VRPAATLLSLALLCSPAPIPAGDWPEFRGPGGQGHSSETGLPLEWSETRNVLWKISVPGRGWSSPAIAQGRIWLTTATGPQLRALSYDAATGRELSNTVVFEIPSRAPMHAKNSHASPTPIVEDNRVYVHFGAHGTAALDASGKLLWTASYPHNHVHGTGGSPVVYKDLLIFNCDGADVQFVVALDKATGKERWKANRPGRTNMAFSTPLILRAAGRDQLISPGAHYGVSYDPATGRELWKVAYGDGFSNVPRPVEGHGLVYITTGFYSPELLALRPDGSLAWKSSRAVPLTPSPILAGDEIYTVSDNGIATCLDARTGRLLWQQRLGGNFSASPIHAEGRLYFTSEDGETTVIATGREFRKLASNSLNETTFASIAVSGGSFYIRTASKLYRIANTR
jgi:outer membrane protein assembly factor BamB